MTTMGTMTMTMMTMRMQPLLLLLLLSLVVGAASFSTTSNDVLFLNKQRRSRQLVSAAQRQLEFGNYAEYPDSCPLVTSCPALCVANATDCPSVCDDGLELCDTGVCMPNCTEYAEEYVVESPCACDDLPVACPQVVAVYETCFDDFADYYNASDECVAAQIEALPLVDFATNNYVKAFYSTLAIVSGLVVLWCFCNTYVLCSAASATTTLQQDGQEWILTGYKHNVIGFFVYACVLLTLLAFQVLLLMLTLFYYQQQEVITLGRSEPVFYDEIQVLQAFEVVWMVGLVWSFAFRYPSSIRDLFLRKCALERASYVAVFAPIKMAKTSSADEANANWGEKIMATFWFPFDLVLRILFSYPYAKPGFETVFCPVQTDNLTGKRSFYYRLKRFVLVQDDTVGVDIDIYTDIDIGIGSDGDGDDNDKKEKQHNIEDEDNQEPPPQDQDQPQSPKPMPMSFQPGIVSSLDLGDTLGDFLQQQDGLSSQQVHQRQGLCGENRIPMTKPTLLGCVLKEFQKPFYLYQNFMVWSWAPYWYYYMAIVNSIVRVTGGIIVGIFQYMSDADLYQISTMEGHSTVLRDGDYIDIPNTEIVPGDVVVLQPGVVCCDMVVLKADRLVVDEAALTGEANPVTKTAIDPTTLQTMYDPLRHKSISLSAGTEILETSDKTHGQRDLGFVISTGSNTAKGKLVTEVLSYQRHKFKFDDEVKMVLCILLLEAVFLVGMVFLFIGDEQWAYAWFYAVFVLGTVIPPLLPTVFVVSVGISAKRLQASRITCTFQEGILIAGKVNYAFFDKTGTLTKQGMDFLSMDAANDDLKQEATIGMAVCHTLHMASDGHLVGNHIDQVSFNFTNAVLIAAKDNSPSKVQLQGNQTYTILKQYEFDSHLQTQSVIVKDDRTGKMLVFVKGSPEAIRRLCVKGVPSDFEETLQESAKSGLYSLAMAFKDFESDNGVGIADIRRQDVEEEQSLQFAAFLHYRNSMRDETPEVIRELVEGSIDVAMITGDSVLTGISIAKAAGMIQEGHKVLIGRKSADGDISWSNEDSDDDEGRPSEKHLDNRGFDLAISGEAWTALLTDDPKYAATIAKHIRVFGRCNPSDKVMVVSHFVEQGYKTLMCGDGQNDCGSLKSAHVGIALSTAEASVVAPFTSLDKDITSVTQVLREGRCALASAFAAYSFYIIYGQIESYLQVINAYFAITFTEWCWVFLDGIWSTLLAFSLPLAKAAKKLSPSRPTASLLGPRTMTSVCGMLAINFSFLCIALATLWNQDFFQCRKWNSDDVSDVKSLGDNYETTVLFLVGGYQYIASAIALNFGYTWRENFLKNYVFCTLALLFTVMQFVATVYPSNFSCIWRVNCDNENAVRWVTTAYPVAIANAWNTTVMPVDFRWKLVGIMASNLFGLCVWQYFLVNGIFAQKLASMKNEDVPKPIMTEPVGFTVPATTEEATKTMDSQNEYGA